jgi:formate dehydrogenase subunit gamma
MNAAAVSLEEIVEAAVGAHRGRLGSLLPILHEIQHTLGHVPPEAVPFIAGALNLSRAEIHGVIGFYHDFRSEPPGEHTVQICRAEACQAVGARDLERHAQRRLGIGYGETTVDGRITLEAVYCLGNCACSPSLRVDDDLHARVTADAFDKLIEGLEAED